MLGVNLSRTPLFLEHEVVWISVGLTGRMVYLNAQKLFCLNFILFRLMKRNFEVLSVIWIWKLIKLVLVVIVLSIFFPVFSFHKKHILCVRVSELRCVLMMVKHQEEKICNPADIIWIRRGDGMYCLMIVIVDLKFNGYHLPKCFLQLFLSDSPFPLYYLTLRALRVGLFEEVPRFSKIKL